MNHSSNLQGAMEVNLCQSKQTFKTNYLSQIRTELVKKLSRQTESLKESLDEGMDISTTKEKVRELKRSKKCFEYFHDRMVIEFDDKVVKNALNKECNLLLDKTDEVLYPLHPGPGIDEVLDHVERELDEEEEEMERDENFEYETLVAILDYIDDFNDQH